MNKKKNVFKICLECGKKYELTNKIHSHFICSDVCREKNKEKKKKYRTKSRAYEKSFKTGLKSYKRSTKYRYKNLSKKKLVHKLILTIHRFQAIDEIFKEKGWDLDKVLEKKYKECGIHENERVNL